MQEDQGNQIQINRPYRCRPTLNQSIIINDKLADLDGTYLQFFNLEDYQLLHSLKPIDKTDQYCARLSALSDDLLVLFGVCKFLIINTNTYEIIERVQINGFVEAAETKNGFIVTLSTDQDGEMKLINCWQVDETVGKITKKYPVAQFQVPAFQKCTEQNISISLIVTYENKPKVYIYWKNTNEMVEVDPEISSSVRFSRSRILDYLVNIDLQTYAEVSGNKIYITSKKQGKQLAQLMNNQQNYTALFSNKDGSFLCSISSKGIKKWEITPKSTPQLLTESEKFPMEKIYFTKKNQIIGINTETKNIVIWNAENQCKVSNFPLQIVRRILKYNETQVCLLLEATADSQIQGEHKVDKYNKLQIYDFPKDMQMAKKAVIKLQYQIDIASAVVCDGSEGSCIRFILNETIGEAKKKYMFRWSPFVEDKKKQIKKREIVGTKEFDLIKIYKFDRILALIKSKDSQTYSVFSDKKTQVCLYDFGAKNFGNYDLTTDIRDVEMSSQNQLYVIGANKISIFNLDIGKKNRLQKVHEIQAVVSIVYPINQYIFVRNQTSYVLYDQEFQFIMKQTIDQADKEFRLLPITNNKFVLKTQNKYCVWNIDSEQIKELHGLPNISPCLTEFMDGKIIVSDKWITAYNINEQNKK